MTLIRKLALALCSALLFSSYSNSQTVDYTTGNLINTGTSATDTTSVWNNGVYVNQLCFQAGQAGNCGPTPSIRAASGNINFSYGTTDLNQVVNINKALAAGGSGVQLSGFNFGFTAKNGNGWDDGRQDYLAAYVKLYSSAGNQVANYDYSSQTNQRYNWTNFNFSETFTNPQLASLYSTAKVGFVGRDNNFWAGNYGPEIMNVSFSLKYTVDPCALNPAYSSTCSGFNNLVTSSNISAQSYSINQALASAGTGIQISGLNYGYALYVGGDWCSQSFLGIFCTRTEPSAMSVNATVTSNTGTTLYSQTNNYTQQDTFGNYSYKYIFPSQRTPDSMGNFSLTASQYGTGAMYSNWSNWIYTPDPCTIDPLSSPSCKGYAVAYAKNLLLGSTVAAASAPSTYSTGINTQSTGAPAPANAPPPANGAPDPTNPAPQGQAQGAVPLAGPAPANNSPQPAQGQPQDPSQPPQQAQGQQPPPAGQQQASAPGSVAAPGSPPAPAGSPPQQGSPANQSSPGAGGTTSTAKTGPSLSTMLNMISSIQAADKATQAAAVQNAQQVVATSGAAAQAQAFQVVDQLNSMSVASSQASQQTASASTSFGPQAQQSNGSVVSLQGPSVLSAQMLSAMAAQSSQTATQSQGQTNTYQNSSSASAYSLTSNTTGRTSFGISFNNQPTNSMTMAMITPQMIQQAPQQRSELRTPEQEVPMPLTLSAISRGSAINDLIESRPNFGNNQQDQQQGATVKKNVAPNELAGGVDVAAMAQVPKGYEVYSIVTLRDAPFYKPEAIYKDNRTVDNTRLLRGLTGGSDAKHQEMVNSQYKIGN